MNSNNAEQLRREASITKMRAMRLRAFGDADEQWQAIVLLHRAARQELEALAAQQDPSEQEQAGTRIEACGMFLEAGDPVRAAKQWSYLPQWVFSSEVGSAMLDRLQPRYQTTIDAFSSAWRALAKTPGKPPALEAVSARQLRSLLDAYPGVAELWWALWQRSSKKDKAHAYIRMKQLEPALEQYELAQNRWIELEHVLAPTLTIEMHAERPGSMLQLDLVSRIATVFGNLLSSFVERNFDNAVTFMPKGARTSSFILDIAAWGLPPRAIVELDQALTHIPEQISAHEVMELVALLQHDKVRLTVSSTSVAGTDSSAEPAQLIIDAPRRQSLLEAAQDAALRSLDSRDIPQANDLTRVFRIVEMIAQDADVSADALKITPRQVAYYRRATKILGLLTESDELSAAGRLIARLGAEDRLRATVVHFESSICGDAWIRWSNGKTLRDVDPDTAFDFLRECVPDLNVRTADRRAKTLIAWYRALIEHHYAADEHASRA